MQSNISKLLLVLSISIFIVLSVSITSATIAQCVTKFENVEILTKDAYGIGEKINGIKISVVSNIGNNLAYRAQLLNIDINNSEVIETTSVPVNVK